MESLTKEEARKIVDGIRKDNGGISAAEREQLLELMPQAVDMIDTLRRKLGAATKSVALSLYSKETRFIYEIIQNADDNSYSIADERDEPRFISFFLHPTRLIVDSNENGFRIEDIKAICSTAESSKKAEGYIGEKGIGFKSVFKVASRAHIQSGPFSFFFQYDKENDENGLGMVTPFNDEYKDLPESVRTRITLSFLQTVDFELQRREFNAVPSALLLFLNKLETFKVTITDASGSTVATQYKWSSGNGKETITKTNTMDHVTAEEKHVFYTKRQTIFKMPADEARQHSNQVTVILGFPVDNEENPIIEYQYVYAFLPLRSFGFTFLIQADFITQASREDVFHSPWNSRILEGIADAFLQAVRDFCAHRKLRYRWLQYLPSESIADDFWKKLRGLVHNRLKDSQILLPRRATKYKKPHQLRFVPAQYTDENGAPLFADTAGELYISPEYGIDSFKDLRWLGVTDLTPGEFLDFIEQDLRQTSSRLKSEAPEGDWRSKVASCVLKIYDTSFDLKRRIQRIPLVPIRFTPAVLGRYRATDGGSKVCYDSVFMNSFLENLSPEESRWRQLLHREGKQIVDWSDALSTEIYFPTVGKATIPIDLPISCVHGSWMESKSWCELFKRLGVKHCDPQEVVDQISKRYDKDIFKSVAFQESISHLAFCYWHSPKSLPKNLGIIDHQHTVFDPTDEYEGWIYTSQSTDEYSPCRLLSEGGDDESHGLEFKIINESYYLHVPIEIKYGKKKWDEWLNEFLGIKTSLQLFYRNCDSLVSNEIYFICNEQPEMLLGLLRKNWIEFDPRLADETDKSTQEAIDMLRTTAVPCRGGIKKQLCKAYLPLDAIRDSREKFKVPNLPVLELPASFTGPLIEVWGFLGKFGVGMNDDLGFSIDVLLHFTQNDIASDSDIDLALLKELYETLRIKCSAIKQQTKLREIFETHAVIWTPSIEGSTGKWVTSKDCLWSSPPWMTVKTRLSDVYKELEGFFHYTLKIRNANLTDSLEELTLLATKAVSENEVPMIKEIYHDIWNHARQDLDSVPTTTNTVVESFQRDNLIYSATTSLWHPTPSCIWAEDRIRIPEKLSIASEYSDLEGFFVQIVKVPKPDIRMHVEALKNYSKKHLGGPLSESKHVEEVKTMMQNITALSPTSEDVRGLRKVRCFPVESAGGLVSWKDSISDFAIVDRVEYQQVFRGKISILAFTLGELHSVGPFLHVLGLSNRYMSNCIEEASKVAGGTPDEDLTSRMRKRASAFYRCAAHFYSDKITANHELYNILQEAIVYTSDGISKSMAITQNGARYSVEHSKANFHMEEKPDALSFYVPRNEQQREVCYLRQLPARFSRYLGLSDPKAEAIIKEIVNSSNLFVVDEVLNDAGIVEIHGLSQNEKNQEVGSGLGLRFEEAVNQSQSTRGLQSPASPTLVPEEDSDDEVTATVRLQAARGSSRPPANYHEAFSGGSSDTVRSGYPDGASTTGQLSGSSGQIAASRTIDQPYIDLLDYILKFQKDCMLPASGKSTLRYLPPNPPPGFNITRSVSAPTRFQTNCKIGAAGELFVFKLLSSISLPEFGFSNWRSNIRNYVSVHPNFSSLAAWGESETSDIVYDDVDGVLTKTLIYKGYLDPEAWGNRRPEYFLEVKTTKGRCNEPFYISANQFNLMQQYSLAKGSKDHVYMILRLFRIGAVDMGLKIYMDPESLRRDGALVFTPESYKVEVRSE